MKLILLILLQVSLFAGIGNIMAMKGSAFINRDGSIVNAFSGMELSEGDEVLTKEKSRVQIMLIDDTVVTIGSNSKFSFEEFSVKGPESKLTMKAKRGFFRSVTGKIGKLAPERFKVKTASATIGIRGTDFSGDIGVDREVFKCFEGVIVVEFEGGVNELGAGMLMEVSGGKAKIRKISSSKPKKSSVKSKTKKDANTKEKSSKGSKDVKSSDSEEKLQSSDSGEEIQSAEDGTINKVDMTDVEDVVVVDEVAEVFNEVTTETIKVIEDIEKTEIQENTDTPVVEEPFEMTLTPLDREIQY